MTRNNNNNSKQKYNNLISNITKTKTIVSTVSKPSSVPPAPSSATNLIVPPSGMVSDLQAQIKQGVKLRSVDPTKSSIPINPLHNAISMRRGGLVLNENK